MPHSDPLSGHGHDAATVVRLDALEAEQQRSLWTRAALRVLCSAQAQVVESRDLLFVHNCEVQHRTGCFSIFSSLQMQTFLVLSHDVNWPLTDSPAGQVISVKGLPHELGQGDAV